MGAGALLWPFDGTLVELAGANKPVICETYPEAYAHVGVRFRSGGSKRRADDRRHATEGLLARCNLHHIELTEAMRRELEVGFGNNKDGEDAFDAAIGLFGMIEVSEGRRLASPEERRDRDWEGWILGQYRP